MQHIIRGLNVASHYLDTSWLLLQGSGSWSEHAHGGQPIDQGPLGLRLANHNQKYKQRFCLLPAWLLSSEAQHEATHAVWVLHGPRYKKVGLLPSQSFCLPITGHGTAHLHHLKAPITTSSCHAFPSDFARRYKSWHLPSVTSPAYRKQVRAHPGMPEHGSINLTWILSLQRAGKGRPGLIATIL